MQRREATARAVRRRRSIGSVAVGATRVEPTPNPDVRIVYDAYGIPHITGKTRSALMYGAGWVMAPTVDHLADFLGKAMTGLPLF